MAGFDGGMSPESNADTPDMNGIIRSQLRYEISGDATADDLHLPLLRRKDAFNLLLSNPGYHKGIKLFKIYMNIYS